jgi:RNA polymerase sigma factor (TIGR02999 family)
MSDFDPNATVLLRRWREQGDRAAADELMAVLYTHLHRLAQAQMARQAGRHSLQPTALVHEVYLRLIEQDEGCSDSRGQFLSLAAKTMRSVLVDHARARTAEKRGGKGLRLELHDDVAQVEQRDFDVLVVDEALAELARDDPELERIVELRFFGGLTAKEVAVETGLSLRSVERGYQVARLLLYERLRDSAG